MRSIGGEVLLAERPQGFVASKAAAWHARAASRDLWDLWALARHGHFTTEAAEHYKRLGPTNALPDPDDYATSIDEERWRRDLAGQTRLTVTAAQASTVVRDSWISVRSKT